MDTQNQLLMQNLVQGWQMHDQNQLTKALQQSFQKKTEEQLLNSYPEQLQEANQEMIEEDSLIEITLYIDCLQTQEQFTFSFQECNYDLDMLVEFICTMKNIERLPDMRLVLHPSFIILDIEAIEDGDRVSLKTIIHPQALQIHQQQQAIELLKSQSDYLRSMTYQNQSLGAQLYDQPVQDPHLYTNTLNSNPDIQAQFASTQKTPAPSRRRGKRGRPRLNPLEEGKSNYYFSIKAATAADREFDKDSLVLTPNFENFDFQVRERDELIHNLKIIAAKSGFKAIIPFTDRNNKISTSTAFCCSLAGTSNRKKSTNCPFKIAYIKYQAEQVYKLQPDHFPYHNHILPITDFFREHGYNEEEVREVNIVQREQEQILGKLMKKQGKKDNSQNSGSSISSTHEVKKKKKDKKSKKKKKKKDKKEKRDEQRSDESDGGEGKGNNEKEERSHGGQSSQEILIFDE